MKRFHLKVLPCPFGDRYAIVDLLGHPINITRYLRDAQALLRSLPQ